MNAREDYTSAISPKDREFLWQLRDNTNIVIRLADEDKGLVIQDKEAYLGKQIDC